MSEAKRTPGPWEADDTAELLDQLKLAIANLEGIMRGDDYPSPVIIARSKEIIAKAGSRS